MTVPYPLGDDCHDTNLLEETLLALEDIGRTPSDVEEVIVYDDVPDKTDHASDGRAMEWDEFARVADLVYRNDWGENKVLQIAIVGKGFVMYRHGYDGKEWWRSLDLEAPAGFRHPLAGK